MNLKIGDYIELIKMPYDPLPLETGSKGKVRGIQHFNIPFTPGKYSQDGEYEGTTGKRIDDWHQIDVEWENGRNLFLCIPPDEVKVLSDEATD